MKPACASRPGDPKPRPRRPRPRRPRPRRPRPRRLPPEPLVRCARPGRASAGHRARGPGGRVFGKILVGTDGSETAKLAVAHAVDLAGALGAELVVATAHGGRLVGRRRRSASLPTAGDPESAIAKALLRDAAQAHGRTIQLRTVAVRG